MASSKWSKSFDRLEQRELEYVTFLCISAEWILTRCQRVQVRVLLNMYLPFLPGPLPFLRRPQCSYGESRVDP